MGIKNTFRKLWNSAHLSASCGALAISHLRDTQDQIGFIYEGFFTPFCQELILSEDKLDAIFCQVSPVLIL